MSYEMLDCIADAYIPLLVVGLCLGFFLRSTLCQRVLGRYLSKHYIFEDYVFTFSQYESRAYQENPREWLPTLSFLMVSIFSVYMIGFLDYRFGFWRILSLDYSTHTALALVLVVNILNLGVTVVVKFTVGLSFLAYLVLMRYQNYHTWLDMISTALIIFSILSFIYVFKMKVERR